MFPQGLTYQSKSGTTNASKVCLVKLPGRSFSRLYFSLQNITDDKRHKNVQTGVCRNLDEPGVKGVKRYEHRRVILL